MTCYYSLVRASGKGCSIECVDGNTKLDVGKVYTGQELADIGAIPFIVVDGKRLPAQQLTKPNERWVFKKFNTIQEWVVGVI